MEMIVLTSVECMCKLGLGNMMLELQQDVSCLPHFVVQQL
jgi:hypothetical protein